MPSDVEIANFALIRVGAKKIESFTQRSQEADTINSIYGLIRDSVLQECDWGFARQEKALQEIGNEWSNWAYAYRYPNDCIALRYLTTPTEAVTVNNSLYRASDTLSAMPTLGNIPFETRQNSDGTGRVILCDTYQAVAVYTSKTTDPTIFPPLFVDAFACRLAAELAQTLLIDMQVHQIQMQKYQALISYAKSGSANEAVEYPTSTNSFLDSRQ